MSHFKNEQAWKAYNNRFPGTEAGRKARGHFYQTLVVKDPHTGQKVYVNKHRLIWLLKYNEVPPKIIDHRNRVTIDNRPSNLRAVTDIENRRNSIQHSECKGSGEIITQEDGRYRVTFKHPEMTDSVFVVDDYKMAVMVLNYMSYLSEDVGYLESIGAL